MNRSQLYLAGILVVQVALILVFRSPFAGASAGYETRPLLPGLEAITPDRVEIRSTDDEPVELLLENGAWRIEDLGGFPADGTKVETLLADLEQIRVRRPVVSSSRYHASFKVAEDEYEARVRLWAGSEGDPDVDLLVGSSPNFRTSHVRLAGKDEVYEARGISPYDLRPTTSSWIERELVDLDETRVTGVVLTNGSGSFELVKEGGVWKLQSDGEDAAVDLDQGKVDSLVRVATDLRLSDAAGPTDPAAHGFAEAAATVVLRYEEPATDGGGATSGELTLLIGTTPEGEEAQRYVTREGFGFTGTIWESTVRRLLEETPEDLAPA
jgi:hypothetical protein